jgi:CubicO group peptidase (beta-lactamase class C family)
MAHLLLATLLVLAGASSSLPSPSMDALVRDYCSEQNFMGSVLVARKDKLLFKKSYGFANLEWGIPNSPATRFRLGSVTKQFTAAAVLLLEEQGRLKIEDPLKKYLPDSPAAWDKITIFNLLTHTAGIPSYTDFPDYNSTRATACTPDKLIERFSGKPLEFEPGEKFKYSNSGYVVLGRIIEKASGQTYAQFVQERIFKPLGMNDSGYDSFAEIIKQRASGYSPSAKGLTNTTFVDMTVPYAAGALYSTVEDMLKWEQGLFGGRLLSPVSLKKMTTPFKRDYAFGVSVRNSNGRKAIGHDGGVDGFSTHASYYPDDALSVIVLCNEESGAPGQIARSLAAIAHGEKVVLPSQRKGVAVPAEILATYAGKYELEKGMVLVISVDNGKLMAQVNEQSKCPALAESNTKFFIKEKDVDLEFFKNEKGELTHLILHQGGQDLKALRQ